MAKAPKRPKKRTPKQESFIFPTRLTTGAHGNGIPGNLDPFDNETYHKIRNALPESMQGLFDNYVESITNRKRPKKG